ncbi:hypothetical protein KSP39_PZI010273 [Platanthera zijinensis]|uniref:Uncharacterized protein n=1 Tax=Platanthera zijinensis TaxID=2320716 RepID=A0AAP0BJ41_9ASPA
MEIMSLTGQPTSHDLLHNRRIMGGHPFKNYHRQPPSPPSSSSSGQSSAELLPRVIFKPPTSQKNAQVTKCAEKGRRRPSPVLKHTNHQAASSTPSAQPVVRCESGILSHHQVVTSSGLSPSILQAYYNCKPIVDFD